MSEVGIDVLFPHMIQVINTLLLKICLQAFHSFQLVKNTKQKQAKGNEQTYYKQTKQLSKSIELM